MIHTLLHTDASLALLTDQYELTMAYGFWKTGMAERRAEFQMFYRRNPFEGGFLVLAGLGTLIDMLGDWRFSGADLEYLATLKDRAEKRLFAPAFLDYLGALGFNCDVWAAPEGTVVFPNEPLLRVQGPILQAQLLESFILNILNFQSLIATKAVRVCIAAKGDPVVDFGLRRAQGPDGALSASRACYIGGCAGTSNTLAGKLLGIPVMGTHAHSWVMAFADERAAFAAFAEAMPDNCVFLVDTYGSINGIRNAIDVARKLKDSGHQPVGIRLDSGDLAYFSKRARAMLDAAGLFEARIMASNELDEYVITSLKNQGARIDTWGVGTKLITAYDDPALSGVYKLSAIQDRAGDWQYKLKLSEQKAKMSIPGLLQAYRLYDPEGKMAGDAIADHGEDPAAIRLIIDPNDNTHQKRFRDVSRVEPLLEQVFANGRLLAPPPPLERIRARVREQLALLDESHQRFEYPHLYPVGLTPYLNRLRDEMIERERERLNG
ncbi:MAG: nicotinate phosphoribosyltransferase [Gammaproteobacteria bacterium]